MTIESFVQLFSSTGLARPLSITPFINDEDNEPYRVWRVVLPHEILVLKEAKGQELDLYKTFFPGTTPYVPQLRAIASKDSRNYLLLEYIPGEDIRKCTREKLILVLNSLIAMQSAHWKRDPVDCGFIYKDSLKQRKNRGEYLRDPFLEKVYAQFLTAYQSVPKTLCHDDLLPFNVMISETRAVFIDWEAGGILPYPVSLARLIAHGEPNPDAFFYMTDDDKQFAMEYYYQKLIHEKGISWEEFSHTMDLFLFYEYCEWIYVGKKYQDTENERYRIYLKKARAMANVILNNQ